MLKSIAGARLERNLSDAGLDGGCVERRVRVGDAAREITREVSEQGAEPLVAGAHGHPGDAIPPDAWAGRRSRVPRATCS